MIGRLDDWKIGRFVDLLICWFGDLFIGGIDALKRLIIKKIIVNNLNILEDRWTWNANAAGFISQK